MDFIIELPPELSEADPTTEEWTLHVDGTSSRHGSGVGIRLESLTMEILEQSFCLEFKASSNEAEFEALITGLRLARDIGARRIHAFCDFQCVTNQFSGDYNTKNELMEAYLKIVQELSKDLDSFKLTKIPCNDNTTANTLAVLACTMDPILRRTIPIEAITNSSIELPREVCHINELEEAEGNNAEPDEPTDDEAARHLRPTD